MNVPDYIIKGVIECVADSLVLDEAQISADTTIIGELKAESLDFMDIIFKLESKFNIALDKSDFDLLTKLGMKREEAIADDVLTSSAKAKLLIWLPKLPIEQPVKPAELIRYVAVSSIASIVQEKIGPKENIQAVEI